MVYNVNKVINIVNSCSLESKPLISQSNIPHYTENKISQREVQYSYDIIISLCKLRTIYTYRNIVTFLE